MYSMVVMAALTAGASAPDCWFRHGCHGCNGCHGGYGCHGCYGCAGCYSGYGNGCWGCAGCWGCNGCAGYAPMHMMPAAPAGVAPPVEVLPKPKPEDKTALPERARLVVEVPADARLFIDDQLMKTPSGQRVFNTPALERGQAYYYILRAEIVRDGTTYTDSKQVVVRAGAEVRANFSDLELTAAAARGVSTARR